MASAYPLTLSAAGTLQANAPVTKGQYGDGSDGAVTLSANASFTVPKFYTTFLINTSSTIQPAGFQCFCQVSFTLSSSCFYTGTGAAASGATAGVGISTGLYNTPASGQSGVSVGAGSNGNLPGGTGGGVSGGGGNGGTGVGGTFGGATGMTAETTTALYDPSAALGVSYNNAVLQTLFAAGGGASGGGDGSVTNGGGGGAGGSIMYVAALSFTNNGTITSKGGAAASNGTGTGGGGGGGGGTVYVLCGTYTGTALVSTVVCAGGNGGAAGGAGTTSGAAGDFGKSISAKSL